MCVCVRARAASKRINMVLELDEAKPIFARLQSADRIGLQEVFIEGDSISMIHYGPSYRRCRSGYANLIVRMITLILRI